MGYSDFLEMQMAGDMPDCANCGETYEECDCGSYEPAGKDFEE